MMAKINSSRYQRNCAYNACDWSCPIRAGAVTPVEAPVSAEGDCNGTNVRAFDGVGCADDCAGSVADLPPRSVHARRRSTLLIQRVIANRAGAETSDVADEPSAPVREYPWRIKRAAGAADGWPVG